MYERITELQKQIEDKEKGILRLEKDRGTYSGGSVCGSGSEVYSIFKSDSVSGGVGGSPTIKNGGEGEIRTHEALTSLPVFKTGALDHSATSPQKASV